MDVTVRGPDFSLVFDREEGVIDSFQYEGAELVKEGPALNIWRAPTDNDANTWGDQKMAIRWREAGLDRLHHQVRKVDVNQVKPQVVRIHVPSFVCAPDRTDGLDCEYIYTVYGSGDVVVDAHVVPSDKLPPLPRVGLQMRLIGFSSPVTGELERKTNATSLKQTLSKGAYAGIPSSNEERSGPMTEFSQKQERLQVLLAERKLDALLLQRVSSFAWATCGAASYVNTATTSGEAALLITPSGRYLITNNIEATRLEQEEKLVAQGWEFRVAPWHEAQDTVAELTRGLRLGADVSYSGATDLSGDLARLRANLTPEEGERFRALGRLCAEAMESATRVVRPGQTECQIAGLLAHEAESRGVQAIVNLIATDGRIFAFRHPLPTDKELERYAMLVLCGRRRGLVCSVTRLVHFGHLPDDLCRKAEAVARIDATFIAATRPGKTLGEILRRATKVYAETGFPDEWHLHHQGGSAGYEPREQVATPGSTEVVSVGQTYAWNPSISGTKSEDTILVGKARNEVLTSMAGWPTLLVTVDGQEIARPAILEVL